MLSSIRRARALHRTFCTAASQPNFKIPLKQLFTEPDHHNLVQKFKLLCQDRNIRGQTNIYEHTVRRLASAGQFNLIEDIIEDQKRYIPISSKGFAARLIFLYGKSGMFDHAQKLFDEMPERNLFLYNSLLGACVNSKKFDELDRLFDEVPEKLGIKPDLISYNTILKAFCEMGDLDKASLVFNEMEENGMEPDLVSYNTLLYAFYKNGRFDDGEKLWIRMVEKNMAPDIRSYNSKLRGLVAKNRMKDAVKLVGKIRNEGLKPDTFTFNVMLGGFVKEGNLEEAKKWYQQMMRCAVPPDKVTFESLIPFACEKGDADFAFKLCERIFSKKFSRKFLFLDESLLQQVVNELVKCSKIEEARLLVQLGESNQFHHYRLELPSIA